MSGGPVTLEKVRLADVLDRLGYDVEARPGGVLAIVGHDRRRVRELELVRRLVDELAAEPDGLTLPELGRRVRARDRIVRRLLVEGDRFERRGRGPATRWHLAIPSRASGRDTRGGERPDRPITRPHARRPGECVSDARTVARSGRASS